MSGSEGRKKGRGKEVGLRVERLGLKVECLGLWVQVLDFKF